MKHYIVEIRQSEFDGRKTFYFTDAKEGEMFPCDIVLSDKFGDTSIFPCTIACARYGGTYEGGKWLAFPKDANKLPQDYNSSDISCACFWENYDEFVGKGDSPQEAYDNLLKQLDERIKMETK